MPTTLIAESPTPVSSRVVNNPIGSHTKAFRRENLAYQTVVRISARFRPMRSENHPPVVAPTNMPTNVAEVMKPIVEIDRCQPIRIAGAANEKLLMSPNSKKKTNPNSHMIRR